MSQIRTDEIRALNGTEIDEVRIPSLDKKMVRAWVNFNGVGTLSVRDSLGVSSVIDNGTGLYTINLASPLNNSQGVVFTGGSTQETNQSLTDPSTVDLRTYNSGGTAADPTYAYVAVFSN